MWAWTLNRSLARAPMVFTRRLTASAVNGPPRSVSKTKAPVVLRCSSRSMRNSSPRIGWTAGPLDLRPLQIGDLDSPQAVTEGNQDQRSVSLAVAPQLGGGDQLLDLGRGQVFAGTHLSVWPSCRYFPINVVWLDQPQVRHHQHFPLHPNDDLPDNAPFPVSEQTVQVSHFLPPGELSAQHPPPPDHTPVRVSWTRP